MWFLLRLASSVKRAVMSDDDPDYGYRLAALLGIAGILIHSLVDFNMQIPANALLFFLLCGLLTA